MGKRRENRGCEDIVGLWMETREQEHKEEEVVDELELLNWNERSPVISYKTDELAFRVCVASSAATVR